MKKISLIIVLLVILVLYLAWAFVSVVLEKERMTDMNFDGAEWETHIDKDAISDLSDTVDFHKDSNNKMCLDIAVQQGEVRYVVKNEKGEILLENTAKQSEKVEVPKEKLVGKITVSFWTTKGTEATFSIKHWRIPAAWRRFVRRVLRNIEIEKMTY